MTGLGLYSYKTQTELRHRYDTDGGKVYFYRVTPVNHNVAAIQFFNDSRFENQIPPPAGFQMREPIIGDVLPFEDSYFVTWMSDYIMSFNGLDIWKLTNQTQQTITSVGTSLSTIVR